jgi:hypothetical protein
MPSFLQSGSMSGYSTHSVLYGMPLKLSVNLGREIRYQAHVYCMTFLPRFPCIRRPCTTWEGRRDIVENDRHSGLVSEILREGVYVGSGSKYAKI